MRKFLSKTFKWLLGWAFKLVLLLVVFKLVFGTTAMYGYVAPYIDPYFDKVFSFFESKKDTDEIEITDQTNTTLDLSNEQLAVDQNSLEQLLVDANDLKGCSENIKNCAKYADNKEHKISWEDFSYNKYSLSLKVPKTPNCVSKEFREGFNIVGNYSYAEPYNYWGKLYKGLYEHDQPRLKPVIKQLEKLQKSKKFNSYEFAEIIVTMVQSIPYVLLMDQTKEEAIETNGRNSFYYEYLVVDKKPYLENIAHGILSPNEFMYTLAGDCDTRSVLLYALLTHFGYDVVVLCSVEHAMLGINLPASGKYVKYKGTKYYFWETTSKYHTIGSCSGEYTAWGVALPSQNPY